MDFYDRGILIILKDGKPRTFQQLLSGAGFSHNTLRKHMDELVDQGLVARLKRPPQDLHSHAHEGDPEPPGTLQDPRRRPEAQEALPCLSGGTLRVLGEVSNPPDARRWVVLLSAGPEGETYFLGESMLFEESYIVGGTDVVNPGS